MEDIDDLRVSPDGGMLAFVTRWRKGWHESEMRSLSVVPATAGSKPAVVADQVSRFPDWSPDGRSLMYVQSEGVDADDDALGQIRRRAIRDSKGAILGEFAGAENLATVVFRGTLKVRCLLDGRVLFTAKAVSLPVLSRDMPNGSTLFILNPGQPGSISRAFSISVDQKLPDALDLFELSPDEKHIAVPGSKGRVSVIAMATGEITPVIDKDGTGELLAIPVWRNSNQLSLVVPAGSVYGSPKREEFVLWSPDKTVVISHGWPDEVISGIK
jgi:dipeptidyl aminopeptidase/acylaminoacyl peptidase